MRPSLPEEHLQDPVTGHMRRDQAVLRPDQTAAEALAWIRDNPPSGRIIYFYVTDGEGVLKGVVPTRHLLLAAPESPVRDIMVKGVVSIPESATVLEACEFFTLHRFLAFPVVDAGGKLLGVIDMELYTDELAELSERGALNHDLFQIIGLYLADARKPNPLAAFRGRFPWLLCNVGGGILAALLSGVYQEVLGWQQAVLALFIPVVLALAESVAIQSVTLALEGLHSRRPTWAELFARLRAEAATGLLLGLGAGVLVASVALAWQQLTPLALCLLGGIGAGVTAAALLGMAIPYTLHLLQRDPQVAAGPIALACADMITLVAYFNLAKAVT